MNWKITSSDRQELGQAIIIGVGVFIVYKMFQRAMIKGLIRHAMKAEERELAKSKKSS